MREQTSFLLRWLFRRLEEGYIECVSGLELLPCDDTV